MSEPQQTPPIRQALDLALRHHRAGRLAQAESIYQQILQNDPNQTEALNLLGVVAHQMGKNDKAVDLIKRALAIKPDYADAHNNLGNALMALRRAEEAVTSYRKVLHLNHDFAQAHYNLAIALKALGNPDDAVVSYQKALHIKPDYAEAHSNLGATLQELGRLEEAVASYRKALTIKPDVADIHNNLGNALQNLGKSEEAVTSYHKALAINPALAEAHNNLGNAFRDLDKLEEAVASYQSAVALKPEYAEVHSNLGTALHDLGKVEDAIASFQKALVLKPDYAEAHCNLGTALRDLHRLEEAEDSYQRALSIQPDLTEALGNYGILLLALGRRQEAISYFHKQLELVRGENPANLYLESFRFVTKAKMRHDIEQFRYLESLGTDADRFGELARTYSELDREIQWPDNESTAVPLSDEHRNRIGDSYNRPIHLLETPEIPGSALNQNLDVKSITQSYMGNAPGMTYFDNLLSPEALHALRRFLMESTIWYDFKHPGGYLGAMLLDGMACPLLFQIADELHQTFPDIFKHHPLNQLWAYKYDSQLTGINVHADFAAINVNFWVTPDSANRNPDNGGLIVHKEEAPLDWSFKFYNRDTTRIREFLTEHDSEKMVVPYAENRVVLFNSNLFHETDQLEFKPGYENRRINITMLFGNRWD